MNFPRTLCRLSSLPILAVWLLAGSSLSALVPSAYQTPAKGTAAARRRPMTKADVQKIWKTGDQTLLLNEIRLRGLDFEPDEDWIAVQLPKLTGHTPADLPLAAAKLRSMIPTPPDLDLVAKEAPDLLTKAKDAAQKRSDKDLAPLVSTEMMTNKARIYDMFDITNFRAYSLGKYSTEDNGTVGVQFFELTTSNVERLYYVQLGNSHGRLVIRDVITGPDVADRFLRDEQKLALDKLTVMFRALDEGDETGVKELCTPGLYDAIMAWGGVKHPGDRLSRGHRLDQVSVTTSVPLDQESIRVVAKISYPISSSRNLVFFVDFERIGNELKVVRIRDANNKVVVYDPNINNYMKRRYGLPDGPVADPSEVVMTDDPSLQSLETLRGQIVRTLQYHNLAKITELATFFTEAYPNSGEGHGIMAAVNQMQGKYEEADKDATDAIEKGATAYFVVLHHAAWSQEPFTPIVLGISKDKIEYLPAPGRGSKEEIGIASLTREVRFDKGAILVKQPRPFISMEFKGNDGKKQTYNFADFGSVCAHAMNEQPPQGFIEDPANAVCGAVSPNGTVQAAQALPLFTPETWRDDLSAVLLTINSVKSGLKK